MKKWLPEPANPLALGVCSIASIRNHRSGVPVKLAASSRFDRLYLENFTVPSGLATNGLWYRVSLQ